METIFDTPAIDLIGDEDQTPIYYWMECDEQEGDYSLTPAFFA